MRADENKFGGPLDRFVDYFLTWITKLDRAIGLNAGGNQLIDRLRNNSICFLFHLPAKQVNVTLRRLRFFLWGGGQFDHSENACARLLRPGAGSYLRYYK